MLLAATQGVIPDEVRQILFTDAESRTRWFRAVSHDLPPMQANRSDPIDCRPVLYTKTPPLMGSDSLPTQISVYGVSSLEVSWISVPTSDCESCAMARLPRIDLPGIPQYIVQRGNNRLPCFLDDGDRLPYLHLMHEPLRATGCQLHAYVLIDNHVRLLATLPAIGRIG
ncbi:transposase [Xanthomonas arboricola]